MSMALDELKAIDFTFLKRNPENQEYANEQKRTVNFFANPEQISLDNKEANKQNLQEIAQLIRLAQTDKTPAYTSDKLHGKIDASRFLHRIICKLIGEDSELSAKLNATDPETMFAALLGVNFDVNGNTITQESFANLGGDFEQAYGDYITNVWNSELDPNNFEIIESLKMFPHLGPITLIWALLNLYFEYPHLYAKDIALFINLIAFAIRRAIHSFGNTIVATGENSINALKGAIGGTNVKVDNILTNAYNNYKKIGLSIKNIAEEIGIRVRILANQIIREYEYC